MAKKKYTLKQKKVASKYWKILQDYLNIHYKHIRQIEADMQMESGIEDLEFFACDNDYVGIGDVSRDYPLLKDKELE